MPREYDAAAALERIEHELIDSMMRNLRRHLKEESDMGFNWEQWQVLQLKYLEAYRKKNQKKYGPQFRQINLRIKHAIQHANVNGQKDEEKQILKMLSEHPELQKKLKPAGGLEVQGAGFFKINEQKLDALINATQNDMTKAEHAVLRRCNDQYRKIIFDAQMYANTGAGTVEKAIDMATHDFIARGIDSIVYKNGARHTISDYADMAIRTAERRAALMGAGEMRKKWGIPTVIVGKRGTMKGGNYGTACPKCVPWLGKVLIDDVWSGGEAWTNGKDRQRSKGAKEQPMGTSPITGAKYPLMSAAIEAGLYHPRCKDGHTTYYEGISTPPDGETTRRELEEAARAEKEEARKNYAERQAEKYERLAKTRLDPENRQLEEARAEKWKSRLPSQDEIQRRKEEWKRRHAGADEQKEIGKPSANNHEYSSAEGFFIDPKLKNGVVEGFEDAAQRVYERFGRKLNINGLVPVKASNSKYSQASYNPLTGILSLKNSSMEQYKKNAEKFFADGWNASGDPYGTFYHEIGHAIWTDLSPEARKRIKDIYEEERHKAYLKWMEMGGNRSGVKQADIFQKTLSRYALENEEEFFSEAFSQIMSGRMRPASRRVSSVLDESYKDVSESGRLARAAQRASEQETLQEMLRNSITIGKPYVEPKEIRSEAFSKKFAKLTDDSRINDKIRSLAQGNLTKNNGTYTETLDIIDLDTGNSVIHKRGRKNALEVALTDEERAAVRAHTGRIIGMHNHPTNIFPTGSDFVAAGARGYEFGIVITNDLRVFKYTPPKIKISPVTIDRVIEKHTKLLYDDIEKQEGFKWAMEELERRYGITWREM